MIDRYGRTIDYIRISITDRCNLRCKYCVPKSGIKMGPMEELLTYEEIVRLCGIFASLGVKKIKLTGGEPLLRRNVETLAAKINAIEGIEQVTLTTNGVMLSEKAEALYAAGIRAVNVSIDTLDRKKYKDITGSDCLDKVLEGIDKARACGLKVKINTVLGAYLKNDTDGYLEVLSLAKNRDIDVRFIELMPIGQGDKFKALSAEEMVSHIQQKYGKVIADDTVRGNGPAEYFKVEGFEGRLGLIHPIHGKFCDRCNRLRMTAVGELKACLCYNTGVSLKELLRNGASDEQLAEKILECVAMKPQEHHFEEKEQISESKDMSMIGG